MNQAQRFFQRLQSDLMGNVLEKAELEQARLRIQQLEQRVQQQDEELDHYRSEVFKSMTTFESTDRCIADELATMYAGLFNWVEGLPEPHCDGYDWGRDLQFMEHSYHIQQFGHSITDEVANQAREELLTHVIFCILWSEILQPLLVGITQKQASVLKELLSNMTLLQPQKGEFSIFRNTQKKNSDFWRKYFLDTGAIRAWRSDAV
jgi:hypothetical protein